MDENLRFIEFILITFAKRYRVHRLLVPLPRHHPLRASLGAFGPSIVPGEGYAPKY